MTQSDAFSCVLHSSFWINGKFNIVRGRVVNDAPSESRPDIYNIDLAPMPHHQSEVGAPWICVIPTDALTTGSRHVHGVLAQESSGRGGSRSLARWGKQNEAEALQAAPPGDH